MDTARLTSLGLTGSQAKAYALLVEHGSLTPAALMKAAGETRTNAYMVLDRLTRLGLAFKDEQGKKLIYRPKSPAGLQKLAEAQQQKAHEQELRIKQAMPGLLQDYHAKRLQPE